MRTLPLWAETVVKQWISSREHAQEHGHNVSAISIGYYQGLCRLCDDTGCFDIVLGPRGNTCHQSHGDISRTLQTVFYRQATQQTTDH